MNIKEIFTLIIGSICLYYVFFKYGNRFENIENGYGNIGNTTTAAASETIEKVIGPAVIANAIGGIGNQLFNYAWAYAFAKEKGWPLYTYYGSDVHIPMIWGKTLRFDSTSREFSLDQFSIPSMDMLSPKTFQQILKAKSEIKFITEMDLLNGSLKRGNESIINIGFCCQSPVFWEGYAEEIKEIFKIPERNQHILKLEADPQLKSTLQLIRESESVAVHVRRGDTSNSPMHFKPGSFQRKAVQKIVDILKGKGRTADFFVFSDDIGYAKGLFKDFRHLSFHFVGSMSISSIQNFYLMTKCKHIIFPGSTFSWWAAYLMENPEKIVITSAFGERFYDWWKEGNEREFYKRMYGTMYHPKEWIVLNPFTGNL